MAEYDKTLFSELGEQIKQPIGCANCHEANTMRLIVTNPALEEALEGAGQRLDDLHPPGDAHGGVRQLPCGVLLRRRGQIPDLPLGERHAASKISPTTTRSWASRIGSTRSPGAPMIKMQHPEYELFTADSTHYKAGVACADCHMPYTRDGAAKFSTHDVKSPLLNAEAACGACHTDVAYVTGRVATIQDQVHETMSAAEDALVAAITAIEAACQAEPMWTPTCWTRRATCTAKRSCAGISSLPRTAWASTTRKKRCASWHRHRPGAPGAA